MEMPIENHSVIFYLSFGGDKNAHLRHRKMNNESVKRCREKKKQQHEALLAGYQEKEEDLKKAQTEIETLKATIKKLYAAYNDVANKNMVRRENKMNLRLFQQIEQDPSFFQGCRGPRSQGGFAR